MWRASVSRIGKARHDRTGRVDAAEHDVRDRAAESDEHAARTKVVVTTVGPYLR
ncbi:hypothetical protein ABZ511_33915 [Nocardia gamkensis]|uniref:hypothetical protein n=1 Tax=Nocardia gamkensis TaxID=352869 RepID=UPI0033E3C5C1